MRENPKINKQALVSSKNKYYNHGFELANSRHSDKKIFKVLQAYAQSVGPYERIFLQYTYSYDPNKQGTLFFQNFFSQNGVNNSCKNAVLEETVKEFGY